LNAAAALRLVGAKAKAAAPDLARALKDKNTDVRRLAAEALVNIGEPAIPPLIEALKDKSPHSRFLASDILARIGIPAVPALTQAAQDKDKAFAQAAAKTLKKIQSEE
jgi:HEAT repeat protein